MSSPLHGAGYLRPPVSSGTKEEVLERCFKAIANDDYQAPGMDERLLRLYEKKVWNDNFEASFRPGWQIVGPVQSHYTDDRMRNHRGRFGHTRSD